MNLRKFNSFLLLTFIFFMYGCGVYSFTGGTIDATTIKNISIQTFYNNAPLGPSNMSVLFTESIKDYYQQNTSLELVDNNGDLQIDGYISNYTITPVAANQGNQNQGDFSALSRITITISATYVNLQDTTFDFDKNF